MIGKRSVPLLLPLFLLLIGACSQKQEETIPEEDYLTEEELGLLEETELESVEEEVLEEDLEVIPEDPEEVVAAKSFKKEPSVVKKADKMPATSGRTAKAPAPTGGDYVIQVGIYSEQASAEAMKSKMNNMGYTAYVAAIDDPVPSMPGRHYRVRLGYFPSIDAANAFGDANLLSNNIKYWVDHKSRDGHTVSTPAPAAKKAAPAKPQAATPGSPSGQTKIIEQPQKPEPKAAATKEKAMPQKQPAKKPGGDDFGDGSGDNFGGDDWGDAESAKPAEQPAKPVKKMPAPTGKKAAEEKPAAPAQDGEKPAETAQEKPAEKPAPQKAEPKKGEGGGDDWEVDEGDWDLD